MHSYKKIIISLLGLSLIFTSCQSLKQPKSIEEPFDYSDKDLVKNEIKRITEMLDTEPVRALWRALLLKDEDVIQKCVERIDLQIGLAIEEKDYFKASNYYHSLEAAGKKSASYNENEIAALLSDDIPALSNNSNQKNPKSLNDCMEASVTIWVDRGVKVQNGAGYADIIIGSGFFIDERGYLVTNHHVIDSMVNPKYEGYSRLYIKLLDDPDTKIPAKVIGYDESLDLALLKAEIEPKYVMKLGSSRELKIGNKVSAIGTPLGLEGTLTSGIISATDRKLLSLGNVIQVDAAINSGNSGGPLIDANMDVQAIVFAGMLRYQGLNFAIPVEYLRQELPLLYTQGEIIHPWIAAYGRTKRNGREKVGLEIQYVMPGGSAFISGFRTGDVITSISGTPINCLEDFQFFMLGQGIESLLKCTCLDAQGNPCEKYLYLEKRPKEPVNEIYKHDFFANSFVPFFGMKMVSSSTLNKNSFTIESVLPGTTADEMNFSSNDHLTVKDVYFDNENQYLYVSVYTKRRKKGFLDITMMLATPLDSPYYF
ncbi:MAG: S1C family serine protease [Treponema sp.]|nr:S1C family serine protease [Treponema sp.]